MSHKLRFGRICHATALLAAATTSLPAAPSAADFGKLPAVDEVLLSPSGTHVAELRNIEGKPYLAVRELAAPAERATRFMELEIRKDIDEKVLTLHWLNDETIGIVLEFDGMRAAVPTVETRLLAIRRDFSRVGILPRPRRGALYNTQLAHRILDLLPDDPEHVLMSLDRSGTGFELGVYRVEVDTGHLSTVETGDRFVADYLVDQRGTVRLRYDVHEKKQQLFVRRRRRGRWKLLAEAPRAEGFGFEPVAFSDDNTLLVFATNGFGRRALFEYDLADRKRGRPLYSDPEVDATGVQTDLYTGKIVGVTHATDHPVVHYFDDELATVQDEVDAALTETYNSVTGFDRRRKRFVVYASGPRHPGTYYLYDRSANELRPLGLRYPQLGPDDLRGVEPLQYRARDGLTIHAYLTRPRGQPPYPMVVLPHGGPTARDYRRFDYLAQFLASRGYAVLQPNYRGSTGYGAEFLAAGEGQWGLAMQDDLEDGARAMIARGITEPGRLAIVGWSYGGYAALIGAIKTPDLYACAVSGAGVTDIPRMLAQDSRYKFATENRPTVGHIRKDRDKLRDNSPINGVDAITIPILLFHGDKDRTVPVGHSKRMASKLEKAKKTHRLVILEDGDHQLSVERNRIRVLEELAAFLERYLPRGKGSASAPTPATGPGRSSLAEGSRANLDPFEPLRLLSSPAAFAATRPNSRDG